MIYRIIGLVTLGHLAVALLVYVVMRSLGALPVFGVGRWIAVFLVLDAVVLFGMLDRRAPVFGSIWSRGPADRAAIALTFDDGPNEPYTSQILDVLARERVKATFFVLGTNAERYPDAIRRIVAEGHAIGNHTYEHDVLPLKGPGHIRSTIRRTSDIVQKICGARPRFFRAPHGWRNPFVDPIARDEGCEPTAWTLGVYDTDRPGADVIRQRVRDGLENGCVILLHDGRGIEMQPDASQLVVALPGIIEDARRGGFSFETISQLRAGGRNQ